MAAEVRSARHEPTNQIVHRRIHQSDSTAERAGPVSISVKATHSTRFTSLVSQVAATPPSNFNKRFCLFCFVSSFERTLASGRGTAMSTSSADDAKESGNGAHTRVQFNLLPTQPQFPPLAGPSAAQAAALPLRSLERIDMADRSRFRRLYPSKREVLRRWSLGRIRNEAFERQIKVSSKHGEDRDISAVAHSGKRLLAHYDYLAEQLHWQEWYRRRLATGMEPDPRDDEHSSGVHSASGERSAPHSSSDEVEEMSASGASGTSESDSASVQSPAISQRLESSSPPAEHTATAAEGSPPPPGTTSRRSSGDHSRRRSKSKRRCTSGQGKGRKAQRTCDYSQEHRHRSTRRSHRHSRHQRSTTTSPSVSPPAWWAGARTHVSSSRSPRSGLSSDSRRPWRPRPSRATSPDARPPRRSGRQDEVRARQPVEPREHHHHSTRMSGHHRTPALPDGLRVPERLLRRIHRGEYIDFSDLLQENMYPSLAPGVTQQALQVQRTEGGGLELAMRSQTKRRSAIFPAGSRPSSATWQP